MVTAGMDVGKYALVVALDGGEAMLEARNDKAGWGEIARWLSREEVGLVGLEASGGYERDVSAYLARKGFEVHLVDPAGARAFARSMGTRAKTDRIDAGLIARYTASLPARDRGRDPLVASLREELRFLEQLEEDRARWKNRAETYRTPRIRAQAETRVRRLKREIADRLERVAERVRDHPGLAERLRLLTSIRGIGLRTAVAMIIHIPELGHIERNQASSLAGVAPYADDSGTFEGKRHISGGRTRLRRALYNAAGMARIWNKDIADFYDRLVAKGKQHCAALIACVRKLLITANAVLTRGKPWTEKTQPQ